MKKLYEKFKTRGGFRFLLKSWFLQNAIQIKFKILIEGKQARHRKTDWR